MMSISLADPAVQSYMFYSAILGLKMLSVTFLTVKARFQKKVFANEEDAISNKGKVTFDDLDVERVRRAHRNDLENIPVFWILGALYLTTSPSTFLATTLFRVCAAGRIMHTIVYAVTPLPQPARGIVFEAAFIINIYMGVKVIQTYFSAI